VSAERTARAIVAGTWGCAAIVMAGSATNAVLAYGALGDNRGLGLATGLAVDIGLCVALIGDRRLYAEGLSSTWGRTLRITTAVMSLVLNTSIAVHEGRYLSALMHAFLPILLIVLTEYGQDVLLKFTTLDRQAQRHTDTAQPQPSPQPPPLPPPQPLPELHRPLASVPVTPMAPAAPTSPPIQPAVPVPMPAPVRRPSPAASVAPIDPQERRLRALIERTGRTPSRRQVAAELAVTEHQARTLLARVTPSQDTARRDDTRRAAR